jgi:hypothetical protein
MKNNKQQTAVEWLVDQLEKHYVFQDIKNTTAFLQAKEMEKEQIITAWGYGWLNDYKSDDDVKDSAEQYYNETYGGNK